VHQRIGAPRTPCRLVAEQARHVVSDRARRIRRELLEHLEQSAGSGGRAERWTPARRHQHERGDVARLFERVAQRVESSEPDADEDLRRHRQPVREVILHGVEVAQHLRDARAVAARSLALAVPTEVRQRDREARLRQHARRVEIAPTVVAGIVHERDATARLAVGSELEHVQQEQALRRMREARALGAILRGLAQLEIGGERFGDGHG
jgi:hypothetical protein